MMTDKIERFTRRANHILWASQGLAEKYKSQVVTPEFMLLAMTHAEGTIARHVLAHFDITQSNLEPYLEETSFPEFADTIDPNSPHIQLSNTMKTVLELSVESSRKLNHDYMGSENLLIGLMHLKSESMDKILAHFDVQRDAIIQHAESYAKQADNLQDKNKE